MPPIENAVGETVERHIKENKIVVFSKTTCPFCVRAKDLLGNYTSIPLDVVQLDTVGKSLSHIFFEMISLNLMVEMNREW